jgi:hypothetical protein
MSKMQVVYIQLFSKTYLRRRIMLRQAFSQLFIGVISLFFALASAEAQINSPEDVLGFPVGADYKLARWETITDYLRQLAEHSDRVMLENRGKTTEGHDFVLVLIIFARKFGEPGTLQGDSAKARRSARTGCS